MAIRFNSGSLSTPETNVYSLSNFNGVDYTTTPTLVNESRGIDMSNYLPLGNSLIKRNGWNVVNTFQYNGQTLHIYNIWKFKNYYNKDELSNTNYIIFAGQGKDVQQATSTLSLFSVNTLLEEDKNYQIKKIFPKDNTVIASDLYSYGALFENRLFILAMNKYLMLYYEKNESQSTEEKTVYDLKIDEVKNQAFTPQVIVGLGHKDSQDVSAKVNDFNLLKNECYIELLNYPQTTEEQVLTYDIGQFFGDTMTNISISKVDNISYTDDMDYEKDDGTYVGNIKFDSETKTLTITKEALEEEKETLENVTYVNLLVKFDSDNYRIVENMKFGIPYGSSGYRDRLFLSGNPEYPNLDIHTNETGIENENWKDYTYFGDMSYRTFGTDAQKITGYGILNNGYMAVFKESSHSLEPNLYIRRSEITSDSDGNYVENFPVTLSGVSVGSDAIGQVINYGNDLLINAPKGIYKINTSESTATQTYEAIEMSYYIRDNLNNDISESCSIIFDGKLYITRKDYKGDNRVYVADQDRYSYIDNNRVYEWWVLDGIEATKFYIFNNELYFTDAVKGLCKFTEQYYDSFVSQIDDVIINDTMLSKDVSVNTNTDMLVISPSSEIIDNIQNNENVDDGYINLRNSTKISFNKELEVFVKSNYYEFKKIEDDNYELKFRNYENQQFESFLEYVSSTNWKIRQIEENKLQYTYIPKGTFNYVSELEYDENGNRILITYLVIPLKKIGYTTGIQSKEGIVVQIPQNTDFDIYELYEQYNEYPLSECFVNGETWYRNYEDELGNKHIYEIGSKRDVYFNKLKLKLYNTLIDFELYETFTIVDVKFYINQPVSCYWQSKYHSLNRLDYLKTIYSITFVPETKRGGVTNIGYRTTKSEVSFETSAEDQDFNFEFINFNDFSFGGANMAKTYTSKKKIKNFSFIQLKFTSNDTKNSTIVSLSFRYKYTRINKGVK